MRSSGKHLEIASSIVTRNHDFSPYAFKLPAMVIHSDPTACSWLFLSAANGPPALQTADAARYLDDIKSLTTPSMEGRGDGT